MLDRVIASRFERVASKGRTWPCILTCERVGGDGTDIEVIAKFSARCDQKERSLVVEALAAMLAADLELPVPEPFLVEVDDVFISSIPDKEIQEHIKASNRIAFGSARLPDSFVSWPGTQVPEFLTDTAAEILIFDAIIRNSDRRAENPNCLYSGTEFGIFDHEASLLSPGLILFWKSPWDDGGFDNICELNNHIFGPTQYKTKPNKLERFEKAWNNLSENRLKEYFESLPFEWGDHDEYLQETFDYFCQVKRNISEIVNRGLEKLS